MTIVHEFSDTPIVVKEGTSIVVVPKPLTRVFYLRFHDANGLTTHEIPINAICRIDP